MKITLRIQLVALLLAVLAAPAAWLWCDPAAAQSYPVKPVRVVVAWPPGGSNDMAGRVVALKLSQVTGQSFFIDNRSGAAGTIGADVVAKSPPDGYTLLVHSTTHVGNPWLYKKLPYDTFKDFAPVALIASQPGVLVANPSFPAKTVKDLIALAKAKPKSINFGSSGNGSLPHLSMALIEQMADVDLVHIPYKGGGPAITALLSGETQVMVATLASAMAQIQAGRLRAIAATSGKRLKALPDVPTLAESGLPGYDMNAWMGILAPAATPKEIVDRLNGEITRVLQMPDVVQQLTAQGGEPWIMTPEQFAERMAEDYQKYGKLIKLTGATIE
ncbi:MAG: tripartite tricarboxylate transporter substrate binding protein [Thermodesulfobacteriota bacterium]